MKLIVSSGFIACLMLLASGGPNAIASRPYVNNFLADTRMRVYPLPIPSSPIGKIRPVQMYTVIFKENLTPNIVNLGAGRIPAVVYFGVDNRVTDQAELAAMFQSAFASTEISIPAPPQILRSNDPAFMPNILAEASTFQNRITPLGPAARQKWVKALNDVGAAYLDRVASRKMTNPLIKIAAKGLEFLSPPMAFADDPDGTFDAYNILETAALAAVGAVVALAAPEAAVIDAAAAAAAAITGARVGAAVGTASEILDIIPAAIDQADRLIDAGVECFWDGYDWLCRHT